MVHIEFVKAWIRAHAGDERAASLVEFALLLALIAVVCIVALSALGTNLSDNYDDSRTSIFG